MHQSRLLVRRVTRWSIASSSVAKNPRLGSIVNCLIWISCTANSPLMHTQPRSDDGPHVLLHHQKFFLPLCSGRCSHIRSCHALYPSLTTCQTVFVLGLEASILSVPVIRLLSLFPCGVATPTGLLTIPLSAGRGGGVLGSPELRVPFHCVSLYSSKMGVQERFLVSGRRAESQTRSGMPLRLGHHVPMVVDDGEACWELGVRTP